MSEKTSVQSNMPSYEQMIASGMHLGRKKSVYNPNMKQYIYTLKDSLYIIDLIKTQENLINTVNEIQKILSNGGQVLFVGITRQSRDAIKDLADALDMPFVQDRWVGGTLSNFKTIMERVKFLKEMEDKLKSSDMDKYTKKERLGFEREYQKMEDKFGGLRKMTKIPEMVFVSSAKNSVIAVNESKKVGVKLAGIINTDSNPKLLDFPIPASDNSKKSIELILETIKNSIKNPVKDKDEDPTKEEL